MYYVHKYKYPVQGAAADDDTSIIIPHVVEKLYFF
jgi:hypothetical protein